jgi:membrane-associated phospholipid phosphatase
MAMSHPDFEIATVAWMASFTGQWPIVDRLAGTIANNDLFEAAPYVAVLAGFWYARNNRAGSTHRREIVACCVSAAAAVLVSRLIQNSVASVRPIWSPAHADLYPAEFRYLMDPSYHSFPSDHPAFLLPLAFAVYRLHRGLGALAGGWLVVLSAVRVYLGLHYPVDLVAGAAIGALAVWCVRTGLAGFVDRAVAALGRAEVRWPVATAAVLFLTAFQFATLFVALRDIGHRALRLWTMFRLPS